MKKCVFAGSFDPFTKGHEEILKRACGIFDEVVLALCVNPEKKTMFTAEKRMEFLNAVAAKYQGVRTVYHEGMLVDLLKKEDTVYTVRGIRNARDYEYESEMDFFNVELKSDAVSVFIPCPVALSRVSSSAVRELLKFKMPVDEYVPEEIAALIKKEK